MAAKKEDSAELNYNLNYNLFLLKTSIQYLKTAQDRHSVNRWVHKLLASNKTIVDMKLRNDFMYHLVSSVQAGELKPPFNQFPPQAALKEIAYLVAGGAPGGKMELAKKDPQSDQTDDDDDKEDSKKKQPDGVGFLTAHPVPQCGAFCYLAVVCKLPPKDGKPKL